DARTSAPARLAFRSTNSVGIRDYGPFGSMAGLYAPLPTLRRRPRGRLRTARGRCGLLLLHRSGLAPPTPCRSPGALVPTKSILTAANVPIIGGHHVLALQSPPEGWQATSLLERCREHAGRRGARGAATRAVLGRDQRHAGVGVAPLDRGDRGRRGAAADAVAVSGRSLRRAAGGR